MLRVRLANRVVQQMIIQQLGTSVSKRKLRVLFEAYDSSGDGRIDASEFKVAYRKLAQQDLPLSDCEHIIRAYDADGNGSIDFDEFVHAIEYHYGRSKNGSWAARLSEAGTESEKVKAS